MNAAYYIPIFIMLLVVFVMLHNQKITMLKKIIKKRKTEDKNQMKELAKKFIYKECIIYSFSGNQINGTIKEVSDGALMIENGESTEAINLDFVVRIREYPRKKNGKKKSVVLD